MKKLDCLWIFDIFDIHKKKKNNLPWNELQFTLLSDRHHLYIFISISDDALKCRENFYFTLNSIHKRKSRKLWKLDEEGRGKSFMMIKWKENSPRPTHVLHNWRWLMIRIRSQEFYPSETINAEWNGNISSNREKFTGF